MIRHFFANLLLSAWVLMTLAFAAQPEPLTPKGRDFISPVWSPDGSQIAVTQSGYRGVWLLNPKSNELTRLTEADAAGFGMSWSHDGQYLATTENQTGTIPRRSAVRIYDTKHSTNQYLSDFQTRLTGTLNWSPNDQAIFIIGHSPLQKAFYLLDNSPSTPGFEFFTILHDEIISYNTASQIVTTLATDGRFLNLQNSLNGETYVCEKLGGGLRIGNQSRIIADLPRGERPRWSPDGQTIVFQIASDDGERILTSDIWRIKNDGSDILQITNTPDQIELNPSLAPDNQTVVYEELISRQIFKLDLMP